jgi:phosphate transport system substrate-binding protein
MGGVVPVVKLEGIKPGELKFTGGLLADIYLGKVTKWNDPAIMKLNPGAKLPDNPITVIYRSDGSGTTFLWTNYLSKVSPEFKSTVGEGTSVKFPAGVGGKGNEGVASYVQKINGSIGYVEYAYAKQNKLAHGQVQNKAGKFVEPDDATFKSAAAGADWKSVPGMGVVLTDQAGEKSWPITGASFILVHQKQEKPEAGREVLKFFDWAFKNGQKMADELDYVPMPEAVVKQIEASWKGVTDSSGKAVY